MGTNQMVGWHNIHLVQATGYWRGQKMAGQWTGQTRTGWMTSLDLVQEPCLEENGEDGLEGKWSETSCLPGSRVGLWIVKSLPTSGLYCMIF